MFGIGSAGIRTKMRRSSSIIIMNMATSNKIQYMTKQEELDEVNFLR